MVIYNLTMTTATDEGVIKGTLLEATKPSDDTPAHIPPPPNKKEDFIEWTKRSSLNFLFQGQSYILSALALVVALAWNEAFQDYFASIPWMQRWGPFAYAIIITVIVISLSGYLKGMEKKRGLTEAAKRYNINFATPTADVY